MNRRLLLAALALLIALPVLGQPRAPVFPDLDQARRAAIVDSLTVALDTVYVFPAVGTTMIEDLRARLERGEYDDVTDPREFAGLITEAFQAISHDLHLRVGVMPPPPAVEQEDPAEARRRQLAAARRDNFGFVSVEHLPGNVGYLRLDGFSGFPEAGPVAVAAMNFLAASDALIIDLTQNGGGSPSMIQLLTSYLVHDVTHLNSFYIRKTDDTKQFWSLPYVPGERMPDIPVYVLTSGNTFSAAEEFTYNLKNLERATIVGETTGGGAHPVEGHQFDFGDYWVTMSLPFGRAVNPITGTNWEGTGIEPHLACSAKEARDTAYAHALETLEKDCEDADRRFQLAWAREGVEARLHPTSLEDMDLEQFAGAFGPRTVRVQDGQLVYQRDDRDPMVMIPMGEDTFGFAELDWFRIRFERDEAGRVTRLVGLYAGGRTDVNERTAAS
jgi:hypothetical protein